MPAKLRRSLKPALLTLAVASVAAAFGFAGTQAPAAAGVALTAGTAPADRLAPAVRAEPSPRATTGPPPTEPSPCPVTVLSSSLVSVDPCLIVGSLQEVGAYGLEDAARDLGENALKGVNLANICVRPVHPTPAPPASIVNACPVFGG